MGKPCLRSARAWRTSIGSARLGRRSRSTSLCSRHPAFKPFKAALVSDGIPYASFAVDDVQREFARLRSLGVRFTQEPVEMGPVTTTVFDDTCGNLIQIARR